MLSIVSGLLPEICTEYCSRTVSFTGILTRANDNTLEPKNDTC